MGSYMSAFIKRLFDFPIKEMPICYLRQEDFTSDGEKLDQDEEKLPLTNYENLCNSFFKQLSIERKQSRHIQETSRSSTVKIHLEVFPGWNERTMTNLQGFFNLFDSNQNGYINLENFCALMESFEDDSSFSARKTAFDKADRDMDGWIDFNDFLVLIYYYNPPDEYGTIRGVAKRCKHVSSNINFVSKLSVGEQIEYGLF